MLGNEEVVFFFDFSKGGCGWCVPPPETEKTDGMIMGKAYDCNEAEVGVLSSSEKRLR
jgi:hypothetical protein